MRVLLVNELYQMGGSEIQTLREIEILKSHGHDVWHITFDCSIKPGIDENNEQHINIVPVEVNNFKDKIQEKMYKWFSVDKKLKKELLNVIQKINPDIIHINVNNYKQLTVYDVLKNFTSVQTVRDFSAVCPNYFCVDRKYQICNGYCHNNCIKKCMPKKGLREDLRFVLKSIYISRLNRFHNDAVVINLCPSQCLTETCNNNGLKTRCLNNSFDFSILKNFEKKMVNETKTYMVYGFIAKHKGIVQIIDAFNDFSNGKDVELHIVGKVQKEFNDEFNNLIKDNIKIKHFNNMSYDRIIKKLENVYSIIVPSLWLENYPNTALEGLATKCLVLGANRGGIPELIMDDRFTFDILDKSDIVNKLENSYKLQRAEYISIVENNFNRVKENNNLEMYYNRLINVFESLLEGGTNELHSI